jgi:uncharacterized protein YfkK (UPF0435 family)
MELKVKLPMIDESIFNDTSNTIKKALENIYDINDSKQNICKAAFKIALKQLI